MIFSEVIGALLIIVTAILADRASEKWKRWCWALFVILVLVQASIQIKARHSDEAVREGQQGEIKSQHTDIQNLMGELRKSETQRQVDNAILRTKLEDYSQLSQLAPALMKLAQNSAEYQRKQYETKVTSDKGLYALTMDTVKKIRDFSDKYSAMQNQQTQDHINTWRLNLTEAERQQKWTEDTNKTIQMYYARQSEFQNSILPNVIYVRNEMLKRKLAEPPFDPSQKSEVNMVLHGTLAGVYPERTLATYLENMARPLSRK